ncbi:MAG: Rrf2 family transcriptional regulator [Bacteroidia bacterium]|nr:Rrf2 family transcriptional regulator [Bacteroidia bacterium]
MLSKKTKYAINALVYLARIHPDGPVLISQIAEQEHIPKKFLEGILLQLKNAGMLGSRKGKSGGYFLLKSPDEVHIAEVIRLFEGAIALLPCVSHNLYQRCEECRDEATCGIKHLFMEARAETVKVLKAGTLSEIIRREQMLKVQAAAPAEPAP